MRMPDASFPSLPLSVCMATFNGARHIAAQVDSILAQLEPGDELVVSDDGSTDRTHEILAGYGDRVRVVGTSRVGGAVPNFERALAAARGEAWWRCPTRTMYGWRAAWP